MTSYTNHLDRPARKTRYTNHIFILEILSEAYLKIKFLPYRNFQVMTKAILFSVRLHPNPKLPNSQTNLQLNLRLQCLLLGLHIWCCYLILSWGPYNWAANRRQYLHCYWSKLSQTLKVGWVSDLYELSTVLGTFLPSTFVHAALNIMEYLRLYQSNFTQTC